MTPKKPRMLNCTHCNEMLLKHEHPQNHHDPALCSNCARKLSSR